jgi:hypothetical protein
MTELLHHDPGIDLDLAGMLAGAISSAGLNGIVLVLFQKRLLNR